MASKNAKKAILRTQINTAADEYSKHLAGKVFLYVYGNEYFEISFMTKQFKHLTGVASNLSANEFYKKAKANTLTDNQFWFDSKHLYDNARKKLPCLCNLSVLTNSLVCVVKDVSTLTLTYKIGVTNLSFTLCLTEHVDTNNNKINDLLLPRSLRVKDKAIENSIDSEFIDFIFERDAVLDTYSVLKYKDADKSIPKSIAHLIDPSFYV